MIKLCYFLCVIFNYMALALGSYPCLCCYKSEAIVYKEKNDISEHLGSVYEFECKPIYPLDDVRSTDFFDVQYKNQIGYIKNTPELSIESCPGVIPLTDQVNIGNTIETTITDIVQTTTPVPTTITTETPVPTTILTTTPVPTTRPTTMPLPTTTPKTTAVPTTTPVLTTRPATKSVTTTTPTTTAVPTTIPTTTPIPTSLPTTTPEPTTEPPAVCSDSWVKYQNSCYVFKFDQRHTQHRSSSLCEAENSHLVFINSKEEQHFIANHIQHMADYQTIDHHLRHDDDRLHLLSVWIGGIYDHHSWSWVDPSKNIKTSLSYTNFWKHYHARDQKVCAAMNGDHHFQWRDFRCTDSFYYICEKTI